MAPTAPPKETEIRYVLGLNCWPVDDPRPTAGKTIYDYRAQLRAKRKRWKTPPPGMRKVKDRRGAW